MRRIVKHLNLRSKATLCILIPTASALAFQASNSDSNPFSSFRDSSSVSLDFVEKIRTVVHGFRRSSRAISTISLIVIDYKHSLHGLVANSNEYRFQLSEVHLRSAKRLLKLCQINKGFYVKAGQFAASLQQMPKEYSSILSSLQDEAVPCPFEDIKEVLIRNLGSDISTIFISLDEQPIAAASIAQVHRATLNNNQEVAIKLFPDYRFERLASEFEKAVFLELDFIQEARNSERTAENFKNNNLVKIPRVYWGGYCCNANLMNLNMIRNGQLGRF